MSTAKVEISGAEAVALLKVLDEVSRDFLHLTAAELRALESFEERLYTTDAFQDDFEAAVTERLEDGT